MEYNKELVDRNNLKEYSLIPDISKTTLRLELSNICNHKCLFCPNSKMKRKKCHMKEELIYKLIKEAASLGIKKIGLFMNGEPFISYNLAKYIKFSKENGISYVFITTNGALANKENLKEVIEAGLDSIKFSINAGSKKTYEKVHGKDDYEKVIQNIKFLYKYRLDNQLNFKILTSFVITKYTIHEVEEHYQYIKHYVDDMVFFNAETYGGQMYEESKLFHIDIKDKTNLSIFSLPNKLPCAELFHSICITCEGYLTLCCNEALNYLVIEDLNKKSIKEAWYSEAMIQMRKRHLEKKVDDTLCYNCIYHKGKKVEPLNLDLFNNSQEEEKC